MPHRYMKVAFFIRDTSNVAIPRLFTISVDAIPPISLDTGDENGSEELAHELELFIDRRSRSAFLYPQAFLD